MNDSEKRKHKYKPCDISKIVYKNQLHSFNIKTLNSNFLDVAYLILSRGKAKFIISESIGSSTTCQIADNEKIMARKIHYLKKLTESPLWQ